jgi:hypothetical protein
MRKGNGGGRYLAGVIVRRMAAVAFAWIVVLGLARGVVALPERCPPATADQVRVAAEEAVGWFGRNQQADGRWVYRYDRDADVADLQPHVVRQAGITLSLYQAHAAGVAGALAPADAGVDWLLGELVHDDDWSAVRRAGLAPTGASALLVAALATRRDATGDPRYDDEMAALGRFLVAMTEPSGAVAANWDIAGRRPVPEDYSRFFTGETYFALALLAAVDPGGGWAPTPERIGRYLATERDRAEDLFPPTSDHWAAYGLAQTATAGRPLDDDESAYAERLAGIFSVEVRFESQRTGAGVNLWVLRGPQVVGSGLGTIGEGLGSLWTVANVDDGLAGERAAIAERVHCVAGMLVDRQVSPAEAGEVARPELARGAWFHDGLTQMDDQQHSLSALLLAEPVLAESPRRGDGASSTDGISAGRALWLAVVAVAAVNPPRVRRLVGRLPTRSAVGGSAVAGGIVAAAAVVAGPLLRAVDVSPAPALVAGGLVVVISALVDAVRRPEGRLPAAGPGGGALVPLVVPALVRPAVVLLAVAVAADAGIAAGVGAAVAVTAAGLSTLLPRPRSGGRADRGAVVEGPAVGGSSLVAGSGSGSGADRGAVVEGPAVGGSSLVPGSGSSSQADRGAALGNLAVWSFSAVAVLGGLDLAVHGVFSV